MSITLNGYDFGGHRDGKIQRGPIEQPSQAEMYPGIKGMGLLIDPAKSQILTSTYTIDGITNETTFNTLLATIDSYQGNLYGTLSQTGDFVGSYSDVMFIEYVKEHPFYSRGGVVGWVQKGTLVFRKLKF